MCDSVKCSLYKMFLAVIFRAKKNEEVCTQISKSALGIKILSIFLLLGNLSKKKKQKTTTTTKKKNTTSQ